jgi:glycosyltransferase involved in cell wall biosynthesis
VATKPFSLFDESRMDGGRSRAPQVEDVLRVLVVGVSTDSICGVRDHAQILSSALSDEGAEVTTIWACTDDGLGMIDLVRGLSRRRQEGAFDFVLLHYSVFAFSWRGVPVAVPILMLVLRRLGAPVVVFAHEFAYPWGRRGVRGAVHAVTQRAALVPLTATSDAVIVTTEERVQWLRHRWWLPKRPVVLVPVFSNIPRDASAERFQESPGRIGVFSFGAEGLAAETVTAAVAQVATRVPTAHLVLIGAPGPHSSAGRRWGDRAAAVGCKITFTGVDEPAEVSRQLAACQVVVFPDPRGPSSRKTSLAAALANGRPVVALEGPESWTELVQAGALVLAEPASGPLAKRLAELLEDDLAREHLGHQALEFAEAHLSPTRAADTVLAQFDAVARVRARRSAPHRTISSARRAGRAGRRGAD